MKAAITKLSIFSLLLLVLVSCKKDAEMPTGEFVNLKTNEAAEIKAISAVVSAKAGADCSERGVCWGKKPNPTLDDFHIANGSGKGIYTCTLTGLEPDQKYYYRAYAHDGGKYVYAQDEMCFTTKNGLVTLTTFAATNIGSTYATLGGVINDNNGMPILERGVCYGLEPGTSIEGLHAASADTTNTFAVALTELENETLYYCKAYVKPQFGSIVYGEELAFTTLDGRPVVSTGNITEITATSAKCSGEVTDEGHAPVLERGICWSKEENPTLEDIPHIASGSGTGSFEIELTGLEPNTTYHVWAYATNALGIRYGEEKTFATKDGLPSATTGNVTGITATSATCSGNVTDDGGFAVTERGICWSTSPNPTLENAQHVAAGSGTGEFSATLTGLAPNTKYYVRAYATNSQGNGYAEDEKSFTTDDGLPCVTTGNVTDITATSAKCSGEVTDDGGFAVTERGICWSTSPNPTLQNAQHVAAGSGTGEFSATLTGLEEGTAYHVRAYAVNSNGTQYGDDVSFTTLTPPLTFTANGVSFTMIHVEGGTFTMGATAEQGSDAYDNEYPEHSVTLSSFYMGETEVTQALWQAVMGSNQSYFMDDSQCPVEEVSWNDCQTFITKLNQQCAGQLNGRQFRLPTEAEWEYAARGGNQSQGYKYSGSNTLDNVAWYYDNSGNTTHAVGTKQANELGLYDMSGNVWEWCSDWYGSYGSSAQTDPTGPATGSSRVFRGGGWYSYAGYCRVSYRGNGTPGDANFNLGLRLSLR